MICDQLKLHIYRYKYQNYKLVYLIDVTNIYNFIAGQVITVSY